MRVDAHVHFWRPARGDDILIVRREPALQRDFLPDELEPLMRAAGIDAAVAIQSAPQPDETQHLLDVCRDWPWIAGIVGWAELAAPDIEASLYALCREDNVVGLRALIHRIPDAGWIASPKTMVGLRALAAHELSLDVTARVAHHGACLQALEAVPALRLIIDHGGGPPIRDRDLASWEQGVRALARFPGVVCKFSGLLEEAEPGADSDALLPIARVLLDAFGAERLLWASNWPVCDLVGGYAHWESVSAALLERLRVIGSECEKILGGNARTAYRPRRASK
jgi:L-fuconolactonase